MYGQAAHRGVAFEEPQPGVDPPPLSACEEELGVGFFCYRLDKLDIICLDDLDFQVLLLLLHRYLVGSDLSCLGRNPLGHYLRLGYNFDAG